MSRSNASTILTGGFCEVWKARHAGKRVVQKCLRKEYANNPLAQEMLEKGYLTAYPLQHPGIVTMLDFVLVPQLGRCIIEEYIDGMTLEERIRPGKMTAPEIERTIRQIAEALGYLHSKQLTHHDLKPANIMITHNGGNVKLTVLGLSRAYNDATLQPTAGTLRYVAPEVMKGKKTDCRSDIYSLGIIISDMIP